MNIFLKEFSKTIKQRKVLIVMDGAGWHKSDKLKYPKNIRILIQPAYSPELNPIEKLWQYIKDHTIKNKIYKTLPDLENQVCKFVRTLNPEIIRSICNVNYVVLYVNLGIISLEYTSQLLGSDPNFTPILLLR